MTIDEAISHALEVAEQNETSAITYKNCKEIKTNMYEKLTAEKAENDCRECAADHRQLAEWLMEYKDLKAEQNDQYVFIHELMSKLKEAKRLLKSATNVLKMFIPCDDDYCSECIKQRQNCEYDDSFKWLYIDEALKLLGVETDEHS